jgi:hypothetical protein
MLRVADKEEAPVSVLVLDMSWTTYEFCWARWQMSCPSIKLVVEHKQKIVESYDDITPSPNSLDKVMDDYNA